MAKKTDKNKSDKNSIPVLKRTKKRTSSVMLMRWLEEKDQNTVEISEGSLGDGIVEICDLLNDTRVSY